LSADQRKFARTQLEQGETQAAIAKLLGVDATTIGRLARREEARIVSALPVPVPLRAMRRASAKR
jgi:hypothetical protein